MRLCHFCVVWKKKKISFDKPPQNPKKPLQPSPNSGHSLKFCPHFDSTVIFGESWQGTRTVTNLRDGEDIKHFLRGPFLINSNLREKRFKNQMKKH